MMIQQNKKQNNKYLLLGDCYVDGHIIISDIDCFVCGNTIISQKSAQRNAVLKSEDKCKLYKCSPKLPQSLSSVASLALSSC
jgi:hypothetical protein